MRHHSVSYLYKFLSNFKGLLRYFRGSGGHRKRRGDRYESNERVEPRNRVKESNERVDSRIETKNGMKESKQRIE